MRKIFQFFSLLVLSCFGALGVSAQEPITAIDRTDNASAYTIKSYDRGYMVYAPTKTTAGAWCSENTTKGSTITVDPADPNNQWMFYKIGESYYLYNVGAEKFLYKDGKGTKLAEYDPAYTVQLLASTGPNATSHPTVIAFGDNQINLSKDQSTAVFTNWNSTSDNGNTMQIVKVADVSDDVQALVAAQVADYEMRKEYNERFAEYQQVYDGALALLQNGYQAEKTGVNLFTDPSQFYSECSQSGDGSVAGACDGDPTTYWHSRWYGSAPHTPHDFYITLPEAVEGAIKMEILARETSNDHITQLDVYASADGSEYTYAGTHYAPTNKWGATTVGYCNVPAGTTKLKFVISATTQGNVFGHFAELKLYQATLSPDCVNAKYPEQAEALRAAIVEAKAVIEKGAMAVTQDVLDKFQYVVKKSQVCSAAEKMQLQSVAPANATTVNYLDKLTLTFDQAVGFVVPAGQVFDGLAVLNEQGEAVTTAALYQGEEENTVVVELAEPVLVEGNYSLAIPEQYVWNSHVNLDDEDFLGYFEDARYNEAVALSYSVVPGPECVEANPEKVQKFYDEFTTVQLHFNEAVSYNGQGVTLSKLRGESYEPAVSVDGQTVTLTFANGPKNPANYVLDVQEGAFTSVEKQRPNDAFTLHFKLLHQPDSFSFTEAEPIVGTTVKSLSTIRLTFPEAVGFVVPAAQANQEETALQVLNEQGEVVTGAVINTLEDNWKAVEIVLAETINVDGNYSLTVPAQYIWNEGFNADEDDFGVENYFAVYNPEFTLKYKVVSSDGPTLEYPALLPVENSKVAELSEVHMTFTSAVKYNEEKKIYAYNKATNVMYEATVSFGTVTSAEGEEFALTEGADVYVSFEPAITEPGVYELVVPANTFMDKNTLLNSVLRYEFTVVAAENSFKPVQNPAPGTAVLEIQDIALSFPEKVGYVREDVVAGTALTVMKNGEVAADLSATVYYDKYNLNTIHVLFSEPITEYAAYAVVLPEKTVWNALYNADAADFGVAEGAVYNPELTIKFNVESPLSVTAAPEEGVVESIESLVIAFSNAVSYNEEKPVTLLNMTTRTSVEVAVAVSEAGVVTVTPAAPVTDYGYYTLSVPQGAFVAAESGFENKALVYQFKINREKSDIFVCTGAAPADGTTVSKLSSVKLTFGETVGMLAPAAETTQGVKVLDADGNEYLAALVLDDTDWNAVNLVLSEPITAAGTYTVSIPAGYVWNNDADAEEEDLGVEKNFAIYNPAFTLSYTVAPLNPVAVSPESETSFELDSENLFYVQLTFPEEVVYNENAENPIVLGNKAAWTSFTAQVLNAGDDRTKMTLVFEGVSAGNYTLYVPAGTFSSVSGERWCEDLVYYYTLTKPANSFMYTSVDPADGATVEELSTITFSWPDLTWTGSDLGDNQVVPMLLNADGSMVEGHTLSIDYGNNFDETVISIEPALAEAGTYTLLLPEKTVYDDNYRTDMATYNPELRLTYIVEGAAEDGLPKDGKTYYIRTENFGYNAKVYYLRNSQYAFDKDTSGNPVAWTCHLNDDGTYTFTDDAAGGKPLYFLGNQLKSSVWTLAVKEDNASLVSMTTVDGPLSTRLTDGKCVSGSYVPVNKYTSYYVFEEVNYDGAVVVTENANYQEEVTVSFEEAQTVAVTDNLFGVMFDQDGEITAVAYTSEEESMGIFVEEEANVNVTFNRLQDLSYEQYEYACQMATEIDFNQEAGKAAVYFRPNSFRVDGVKYDKEISKCYAVDGNGTTGIETVKTESADDIFDLQGRRVVKPVKGNLYIKNGEKLLK